MTAWSKLPTSSTFSSAASKPLPLAALTARLLPVVRAVVRQMAIARPAMRAVWSTTSGSVSQAVHSPPD